MNNSLVVYLNKRLNKYAYPYLQDDYIPGPVITISREVGCGGVKIARKLAKKLDKETLCKKWRVLSKEIFQECAHELGMETGKLSKFLKESDRNTFDEILAAFGEKRYKSERQIRKTVIDVIRSFAVDGYCIIVGQGGHIIASDIDRALHVRLIAPLPWRIERIAKNHQTDHKIALDFIEKTEKERASFRKHVGEQILYNDRFDMVLNLSRLSSSDVVDLIFQSAKKKGLVNTSKKENKA